MSDVTMLLKNAAGGDTVSLNRLYEQVYSELRAIAIHKRPPSVMSVARREKRLTVA